MPNSILTAAQALLTTRYQLDAKDAGVIGQYNRQCAAQLVHVTAELAAHVSYVNLLENQIKKLKKELAYLKNEDSDYEY